MELYKEKLSELSKIPVLKQKALHYVFEQNLVPKNGGMWIEFGTYDGRSINKIALYTEDTVYGFDSFEGLPEPWVGRLDQWGGFHWPAGTFSLGGKSDFFIFPNVKLIKGWFKDSLPEFFKENKRPIDFIHLDSDIYSSAKDIFDNCYPYISNGCVIVFDELVGYPNFEEHEWKAWWEFVEKHKIEFEWIGGNSTGEWEESKVDKKFGEGSPSFGCQLSPSQENVAVRITKNPSFKI